MRLSPPKPDSSSTEHERHLLRRLRCGLIARASDERGFTMVVVMGTLLIASLMSIAAYAAIDGDIPQARVDQDRKQSYSAAEAGIAYYLDQLDRDNAYWAKCTNVPAGGGGQPSPVNQPWNGTSPSADPRTWRTIPGSPAQYTIELLPANGNSQCVAGNDATMIDAATGTFKIRATGRPSAAKPQRRSLIATFKRDSFLNYLYFTNYEAIDPDLINFQYPGYGDACAARKQEVPSRPTYCDITFASDDTVNGPLHTNDRILTSCSTTFGRTSADQITTYAPSPGWTSKQAWPPSPGDCSGGTPNFLGTFAAGAPEVPVPPENSEIKNAADPANYLYKGKTTIEFTGSTSTMKVTNTVKGLNAATVPLPANGVIYVDSNTGCTAGYKPGDPYNEQAACGNVYVKGQYQTDVTIASAQDIIVNGNLTRSGDVALGLVANKYVRVYHPVTRSDPSDFYSCTNQSSSPTNVTIEAAILALQHSFLVDNYACGASLGTLTVNGVIAQSSRGPVRQGSSGYTKNYVYDDRLRRRSPPKFLDPVQAAWTMARQTEQSPAR